MKNECRNGIKKIASLMVVMILMLSLLAGCGPIGAKSRYELDVVNHTSDFYINDFAGVFSEEQKNKLMENAVGFDENSSGIQVVITTVESLDSAVLGYEYIVEDSEGNRVEDAQKPETTPRFTIEEVSYSMYSEYGIGEDDMGILILFSTGDREVRIETGRQMQFYITDSISGRLLDDYGMDYFREDKFAEGLISLQEGVIAKIQAEVPSDWHTSAKVEKETESQENSATITPGVITDDANENSIENATTDKPEEKDPAKGILWGLFGSIAAAFAAVGAFIRQMFKGKSEREAMERAKNAEVAKLKANHQAELDEKERAHRSEVSRLKGDYQRLVQVRDTTVAELNHEIDVTKDKVSTLTMQLEQMTDKYTRAQQLHPEFDFDKEVHDMIEGEYKEEACKADAKFAEVLNTAATKDNENLFKRALDEHDSIRSEVKKYITSSRTEIKNLYDEAVALRKEFERLEQEKKDKAAANKAYESIKATLNANPVGSYRTYEALTAALALFTGLSVGAKRFFPDCKMISEVERLQRTAETDHDNYTAAKKAAGEVEGIIGNMYSADEDDRDKLARAMRYYRNLTTAQQAYFPDELLRKLKKLINEADEDHRRQERRRDDERRRRQQQMRSSSMSSSHRTSYGGHGGRPSGGGASRRF